MGKAHAVALSAVGAVFDTELRPRLEMICASQPASAEGYRKAYGFRRATAEWRDLVADPRVEAAPLPRPPLRGGCRCFAKNRWAPRWRMRARCARRLMRRARCI